jgi:hypothetical protein
MEIPLYLAMTAAELQNASAFPPRLAWMACHFSAYGTGLSNVPKMLPQGAMLMLNDRTPICGHDPKLVAQTLCDTAKVLECDRILLDFQRKDFNELFDVIREVLEQAICPVGVSSLYADGFDCPVLVPPIMPHVLPEEALSRWSGREIWLEVSAEGTQISVTEKGSQSTPLAHYTSEHNAHWDQTLHCHYEITIEEDRVLFQLGRTEDDRSALIKAVGKLGVTCALSLWQEMHT